MKTEEEIREKIKEIKAKSKKGDFIKRLILETSAKLTISILQWVLEEGE